MENEFVPYEQSLALKELGFDAPCLKVGNPNGHTMWKWIEVDGEPPTVNINDVIQVHYDENWTQIPTYSQSFKWFRENHNLLGNVYSNSSGWLWEIHDNIGGTHRFGSEFSGDCEESGMYTSFEKAELECLIKLIKIINGVIPRKNG